jgi:SAM-dependent methyltransferase
MKPRPRLASSSGGLPSAVGWAQLLLEDRLGPGDVVVDATAGNGHDTLFLCQRVLPGGHVFAFDVQGAAVEATRKRLLEHGVPETGFTVFHAGHETLAAQVPLCWKGKLAAVMFNLGYLPGSDKTCITETSTTLLAVSLALEWLAPGGLLTIAIYPGHAGGADEARRIAEWGASLDPRRFEVQQLRPVNRAAAPPECWVVWKRPA